MTSTYTFGNATLQYLQSHVGTRFNIYLGVYNPVQITTTSQDVLVDVYGQPQNVSNVDLLSTKVAPYAPQPNLGSNRVGFVGEPLFFDGSRSTQRGNLSALNHTWTVSGPATVTPYSTALGPNTQCSIVWSTPGTYSVALTVTDRFGATATGTRQVVVYADRDSTPVGVLSISNINGSLDNGGWTATLTVAKSGTVFLSPDNLPVGTYQPVVLYCETQYEVLPGTWEALTLGPYGAAVPGQFYSDPRILFAGYVQQGSATQNSTQDQVTYTLQTPDMILREASIHNLGYYHTTYNARAADGTPTSLKPSQIGDGQLVADLTSEDVYRSLLADHCNIGQYHDLVIWRDFLPVSSGSSQIYALTYSTLSATEGTIWDALTLLAQNEFADVYCAQDSSLCIGPSLATRGYDLAQQPTTNSWLTLSNILNLSTELNNNAIKGAQSAYLHFLFGPNAIPQPQDFFTAPTRTLSGLIGPPVVGHFSDLPFYDTDASAPAGLWDATTRNWPQDLTIRPLNTTISEHYTGHTAFVKLVATLVTNQNVWAAWYPQSAFTQIGLQSGPLPSGNWQVMDQLVAPDITAGAKKTLAWQYLWEMARRLYFGYNAVYSVTINGGCWPWARLHDLIQVSRQKPATGPLFTKMPCVVRSISHQIDLNQQQWYTEIDGDQIAIFSLGPLVTPPFSPPTSS